MSVQPLLKVDDLKVHFPLKQHLLGGPPRVVKALDGVSFALMPGETLGIVGESGCGKSTLCRAVLRLVEPTDGTVVWLGKDFSHLSGEGLRLERRNMQIIFQDPLASLDPRMTVRQIIERPLLNFPSKEDGEQRRARVAELIELVGGSPNWLDRYPHEFSGGQCQRIGIARALILRPKLLVCDEPVSALDVSVQAQIINLLMELQEQLGLSYLFISHNLSVVRHISHRVMVLYLGKVAELADRDEIYRNPRHPYTQALLSAVPLPDPKLERSKKRVRLEGDLPSPLNPPSGCVFRTRCPLAIDRCAEEAPRLEAVTDSHVVSCHRWQEPIELLEPASEARRAPRAIAPRWQEPIQPLEPGSEARHRPRAADSPPQRRTTNWGLRAMLAVGVAAWQIYDMATVTEAPRRAVVLLGYFILGLALAAFVGSLIMLARGKSAKG